jgi:signal transduction histidine kinase
LYELGITDDRDYARIIASVITGLALLGMFTSGLVLVYPHPTPGMGPLELVVPSLFGLGLGVLLAKRPVLARAELVSRILFIASSSLAFILVLLGPEVFPYLALQYLWVAAAFPFLSRGRAMFHLLYAAVVCAVILAVQDGHWSAVVEWELIVGTLCVAVAIVEFVVNRITTLALEQRDARRQLERANERLEEVNGRKRDFLAATSHELRTPLNAILGFSDVLGEQLFGSLNDRQLDYVADIRSSGQHLLSLIDDVLDVTKVESGRLELTTTDLDVTELLADAVTLLRAHASRRSVALSITSSEAATAVADARLIRQVLLNLLTNAVEFTPAGGSVEVGSTVTASGVRVFVTDAGPGIPPHEIERIFEPFEQGSERRGGTGLGLPLARRFVEAHGGQLTVESAVGHGSTFSFSLPRRPIVRTTGDQVRTRSHVDADSYEDRQRNTRVVTAVSLCGIASGLVALFTLLAVGEFPDGFRLGPLLLLAIPAVCPGLVLRFTPLTLDARGLVVMYLLFVSLTSAAIYFAGSTFGPALSGWYVWGSMALFMLMPRRRAVEMLAVPAAGFALVLALQPGNWLPLFRWLAVIAACLGPGLLVAWLMDKLQLLTSIERAARDDVERSWLELEQVSRHKTEFLANMSHELRAPLNAVIGFADVLHEQLFGPLTSKQAEYVSDIRDAGRHLLSLINDILDLAKVEAGHVELSARPVVVEELVCDALSAVARTAAERGVRINVEMNTSVSIIDVDVDRFGRALANLLSNAVKFSPDRGEVDVSIVRRGGEVVFSVRDQGPGIAASDQSRIFDEFQQAAPASLANPGAGLGLALARRFAELHAGRLEVESAPGSGSTFRIAIPATSAMPERIGDR